MSKPQMSLSERLQWVAIAGGVIFFLTALVLQQIYIDSLNKRIARSIESNNQAIAMLTRKLVEPTGEGTLPAPSAPKPANSVNLKGTRATITIPGDWQVSTAVDSSMMFVSSQGLTVRIKTAAISQEDFQAWFKKNGDSFKPGLPSERITVGPNQVLLGGKLAIDETFSGLCDDCPGGKPGVWSRLTFVRDGGTVIVFSASTPETQSALIAAWDEALKTLQFAP
ncbi:hypothetical protein EPN90_04900 [Patescibacteria group bacterium]|nr:MAG: hypothetical protein EPN90_04900 [Patescibacteria group bacterium]